MNSLDFFFRFPCLVLLVPSYLPPYAQIYYFVTISSDTNQKKWFLGNLFDTSRAGGRVIYWLLVDEGRRGEFPTLTRPAILIKQIRFVDCLPRVTGTCLDSWVGTFRQ